MTQITGGVFRRKRSPAARVILAGVAEQQLDGGIANAGQVVRVGPHVLRPSNPHSGSIHAFLRAVRHAGFEVSRAPSNKALQLPMKTVCRTMP